MQYLKVLGYITLHLAELLSKSTYNKRNQLLRYKPLTRQPIVSACAFVSKGLNSCYIVNGWVFSLRQHFFHVFICSKYIIAIQYLMWHELEHENVICHLCPVWIGLFFTCYGLPCVASCHFSPAPGC